MKNVGFLVEEYKVRYYYWEIVEVGGILTSSLPPHPKLSHPPPAAWRAFSADATRLAPC